MNFIDKEKLLRQLSDKFIEGIVNAFDEYTIIFIILTYFLLVVGLNVVNSALEIIKDHCRAIFALVKKVYESIRG